MSKNRNQNNLLVEIMIAVLFFALCATVILETFMASRTFNLKSAAQSAALVQMQDVGEQLYAARNPEETIQSAGFCADGDIWSLETGLTRLELAFSQAAQGDGVMRTWQIRGLYDEALFAEIPGARYIPGGDGR